MLEEVESSRTEARRGADILELANRTLYSGQNNILWAAMAKETRLEERIGELVRRTPSF